MRMTLLCYTGTGLVVVALGGGQSMGRGMRATVRGGGTVAGTAGFCPALGGEFLTPLE